MRTGRNLAGGSARTGGGHMGPGPEVRRRVRFLMVAAMVSFLGLLGRTFWVQVVEGADLRRRAEEARVRHIPVEARRGPIVDARGRPLALSVTSDTVVASPAEVRDPERTASLLAGALGMEKDEVLRIITRRTSFEYVRRKVPPDRAAAVRRLRLAGIYLTQESARVYPKGSLAAGVLGLTGVDSQGLAGVELIYDKELRGRPGSIVIEYDARNRQIPQAVHRYLPPEDGLTLQLSLDETIQHIAERELDRLLASEVRPRAAWIVVLDPATGAILALAQRPGFDPNKAMGFLLHGDPAGRPHADQRLWRNVAVADAFPPGSVFKPVTAAAALEEGKVSPETPFYDTGHVQVPGGFVTNWDGAGLGSTNFAAGFERSANTIFAQVGLRVGVPTFYRYLRRLNLLDFTGVDLPGEGLGMAPPERQATQLDLALMAFGQTLTLTPIQMAAATAALINGGVAVRPHVGKALLDRRGRVVRSLEPPPGRRVLSPRTSETIRALMMRVVDEGTGRRARIPGYSIGGKTGTSQKVIGGRVVTDRHIASFIGFAPWERPRILVYVMVDEPQGMPYGGVVAAPVFERVTRDVLHYLGVEPTRPLPEPSPWEPVPIRDETGLWPRGRFEEGQGGAASVPDVRYYPPAEARRRLEEAGFAVSLRGAGIQVQRQVPPPGARVKEGTAVVLVVGSSPGGVHVPDVLGLTLAEAARAVGGLGLAVEAEGTGLAAGQEPAAGALLQPGGVVRVRFRPPEEGIRPEVPTG